MLITATNSRKAAMVVTDPAAGALVPGSGELVVWVGATAGSQVSAVAGIQRCLEGLREAGTPGTAYGASVDTSVGADKGSVTVVAPAPTVTDDQVGIAYAADFKAVDGASITSVIKHAIEVFVENSKDS